MSKKNHIVLIACSVLLVALIAVFAVFYFGNRPEGTDGTKNITVSVVMSQDDITPHKLTTDAEFLKEALLDAELVSGTEGDFGLYITTVDGYTADDSKNEWWCVNVNGEMAATGVDEIAVNDGDVYELILSTY